MDLKLRETGNGGDINFKGRDLSLAFSFENMPYLALFGGNVEASTPSKRLESDQAFDWWGNALLFANDKNIQFNSLTERTLHNVALNSAGRVLIEQAIKKDLEFMQEFAEVSVSVAIISDDVLQIDIGIKQPNNLVEKKHRYMWDAEKGLMFGSDDNARDLRDFNNDFNDDFN